MTLSFVGVRHLDRQLRAVAGRVQAGELEHSVSFGKPSPPVAVHAAMEQHRGQAVLMGLQDALDDVLVLHVGRALVVHDDVEALVPLGLS